MQRTEGEKRKVLLIDAKDLVELVCSRHMTDGLGVKKKKEVILGQISCLQLQV